MRVAVLSRNRKLYSTCRLVKAAEIRSHVVHVLDTTKYYMNIKAAHPKVHYRGEVLPQFEMISAYPLSESVTITRACDKLRSLQILSHAGIGLPATGFASSPDNTLGLIKMVSGAPLMVKLLEGTQGKGVVPAKIHEAAESAIDAFRKLDTNIPVQQFIKDVAGMLIEYIEKNAKPHRTRTRGKG